MPCWSELSYARYAVSATYATTNFATVKAVVKKYPGIPKETVLRNLVASQPRNDGKWFAAVKDAGFFELANRSRLRRSRLRALIVNMS